MISFILINWLIIFLMMTFAWCIYMAIKNPGIIDVFWSLSIAVTGFYLLWNSSWNNAVLTFGVLLLVWSLRLAGYLFITRILPNIQEARYVNISKKWRMPAPIGFFLHFQFQGILAMLIASPFYWIKDISSFNILNFIAPEISPNEI